MSGGVTVGVAGLERVEGGGESVENRAGCGGYVESDESGPIGGPCGGPMSAASEGASVSESGEGEPVGCVESEFGREWCGVGERVDPCAMHGGELLSSGSPLVGCHRVPAFSRGGFSTTRRMPSRMSSLRVVRSFFATLSTSATRAGSTRTGQRGCLAIPQRYHYDTTRYVPARGVSAWCSSPAAGHALGCVLTASSVPAGISVQAF